MLKTKIWISLTLALMLALGGTTVLALGVAGSSKVRAHVTNETPQTVLLAAPGANLPRATSSPASNSPKKSGGKISNDLVELASEYQEYQLKGDGEEFNSRNSIIPVNPGNWTSTVHLRPFIINTLSGAPITVTKTEDTFDGICDADCSLREAVGTADPGDSIDIPAGTYTLTLGSQISIDKDLILDGEGAGNTIIQAATEFGVATYRVFNIASGEVTISDVTIRHGVDGLGGAIENSGLLILASSTVSGSTGSSGGGIFNGSTLTVINSTISGNTGSSAGGGIYNQGTLTVTNSTISGNTGNANGGGGIFNGSGAATINNSTISGNTSNNVGGGINRVVGTVELINTIVAGNTGSSSPDCAGSPTSLGHNLVGHLAGCGYVAAAGDVTGTLDLALDPMLAPLQNYGGPTETHALLPGSAAIDAANPATPGSGGNACEANDQRGIPRPLGAACDIGTYEYSLILTGPTPGLAGVDNTLEVTEATPGATVTFGFGTTAGSTAIPGCPGQTVDIASPQVAGSAVADGSGNASISQTVPVTAAGKTVRLVAVQLVLQRRFLWQGDFRE